MKKILCLILLIVISLSLTSCRKVELISEYGYKVTFKEFKNEYKPRYEELVSRLKNSDFYYEEIFVLYTIDNTEDFYGKYNTNIKNSEVLRRKYHQDINNKICKFVEKGIVMDTEKSVYENKNDVVLHFDDYGTSYIKDSNGEVEKYHILFDDMWAHRCRVSYFEVAGQNNVDEFYIDDNKFTVISYFDSKIYTIMQIIFLDDIVTFYRDYSIGDEIIFTETEIKAVIKFKNIDLKLE